MEEIWKTSTAYPTHEASSLGRVRRVPFMGQMPHGGPRMYGGKATYGAWAEKDRRYVTVIGPAPVKTVRVARIVCDAFNGPPPKDAVCMHLDENSRNNRPENLAWGTQKENLNARGFLKFCSESPKRAWNGNVIPFEKVMEIRSRNTESRVALAKEFGIAPCSVSNIIAGRTRVSS